MDFLFFFGFLKLLLNYVILAALELALLTRLASERDPPVSALGMLGLKVYATILGLWDSLKL